MISTDEFFSMFKTDQGIDWEQTGMLQGLSAPQKADVCKAFDKLMNVLKYLDQHTVLTLKGKNKITIESLLEKGSVSVKELKSLFRKRGNEIQTDLTTLLFPLAVRVITKGKKFDPVKAVTNIVQYVKEFDTDAYPADTDIEAEFLLSFADKYY